jgi:hypothetical protein
MMALYQDRCAIPECHKPERRIWHSISTPRATNYRNHWKIVGSQEQSSFYRHDSSGKFCLMAEIYAGAYTVILETKLVKLFN